MPQNANGTLNWGHVTGSIDYQVDVLATTGDMNSGGVSLNGSPLSGGTLSMPNTTVFGSLDSGSYHLQIRALSSNPADHADWSSPPTLVVWDNSLDPVDSATITFS